MAWRVSTGAFRLRRPCLRRRAAVVPRTGRFSGVNQGRHSDHLRDPEYIEITSLEDR
jgi:hypothetical protein